MLCGLFPTLFTLTAFLEARLLLDDVLLLFADRRRKSCARAMFVSSRIMASKLIGGIMQRWCWSCMDLEWAFRRRLGQGAISRGIHFVTAARIS